MSIYNHITPKKVTKQLNDDEKIQYIIIGIFIGIMFGYVIGLVTPTIGLHLGIL